MLNPIAIWCYFVFSLHIAPPLLLTSSWHTRFPCIPTDFRCWKPQPIHTAIQGTQSVHGYNQQPSTMHTWVHTKYSQPLKLRSATELHDISAIAILDAYWVSSQSLSQKPKNWCEIHDCKPIRKGSSSTTIHQWQPINMAPAEFLSRKVDGQLMSAPPQRTDHVVVPDNDRFPHN